MVWGSHHPFPAGGKGRALARSVVLGERLARWVELTPPVGTVSYRGKSYKKPHLSVWPLPCHATSPLRVSLIGWAEQGCCSLVYSEPPAYVRTAKQSTPPRSHLCHLSASTQEAAVQQGAIFCRTSQPLWAPFHPTQAFTGHSSPILSDSIHYCKRWKAKGERQVSIKECLPLGKRDILEGSAKAQGQKWVRNYTVRHWESQSTFGCLGLSVKQRDL